MNNILTLSFIALLFHTPAILLCCLLSFIKKCEGDNGSCDEPGDIASTEDEVEVDTPEETEPTNGGTQDDQPS